MEAESACAMAEQEDGNQKNNPIFRYRDSPEEIQEEG